MAKYAKYFKLDRIIFLGLFLIHFLLITYLGSNLPTIFYKDHNFLALELLGLIVTINNQWLILFELFNMILIWLVGKKLFSNSLGLVASSIYALSLWSSYLVVARSFYIYLLFLLLLLTYSIIRLEKNNSWGKVLFIGSSLLGFYSSVFMLLLLPLLFFLLVYFKIVSLEILKRPLIILVLLSIPLIFLIFHNLAGARNILSNEVKIFADPGLVNNVNRFQGQAKNTNLGQFSRLAENKYVFGSEFVMVKFLKQLIPPTFFTSQEKLLSFSFSPPIYLGFFIPFCYGFYLIWKLGNLKMLLISTLLVIPSLLSSLAVDLNRLVLFYPVVIFVISYGTVRFYSEKAQKNMAIFLSLTIVLVFFQFLLTLSDIQIREKERYEQYHGQNYQLGKQ